MIVTHKAREVIVPAEFVIEPDDGAGLLIASHRVTICRPLVKIDRLQALCCVCNYFNDVEEDEREIVCENCLVALMVYEDGSTEPM